MNFRSIHRSRTILGSILLALCCLPQLLAQTDPALETGLKPFGSYQGSDIDFVSTTTGRLHVHIPLFSVPSWAAGFMLTILSYMTVPLIATSVLRPLQPAVPT